MQTIKRIKSTWTYRNIQLLIIVGLVTGIALESQNGLNMILPQADAELSYEKEEAPICDLDCEIKARTIKIFEENREVNMEEARLDALVEMRDVLVDKIGESPYYDYDATKEKYGY